MRAMDQPIEDRVRDRGVAQVVVPALARQLTGDHRRAASIPIVEHLEQVVAVDLFHRGKAPVVEDEHIDAGEPCEQCRVRAVRVGQRELFKEPRQAGSGLMPCC